MTHTLRRALAAACLLAAGHAGAAAPPPPPATPAPPVPVYTVYAAGDIAHCAKTPAKWSGAEDTAKIVEFGLAATPHAAVLTLGDNVYQRATASAHAHCYHPTWGRFKERTYPAPGNHEYATPGASGYFGYFGKVAGPGYYTLKLGQWRLFSLDSNLKGAAHAAQIAWLKQELASATERCTLAYWHHPLYSSGGHGRVPMMRDAWELLYQAGAEIVLSGHDHNYERFAPQDGNGRRDTARGMRQFVVGTGGAFLTPILWPMDHSEVRDNTRTGVLRLVLHPERYEWEFLEAAYQGFPNGPAPDRGAGQCH